MTEPRRSRWIAHSRAVLRGLVVALLMCTVTLRHAHADDRITDDTAYTVQEGHVRLGLWKLDYGVHGVPGLEIGTYTLPYVSWALDVASVNGHAKYRLLDRGRWTASIGLGAAYADLSGIEVPAQITVLTPRIYGAARLGRRFTIHAALMYNRVFGASSYQADEATELNGALALTSFQAWLAMTYKVSRGWSFYLENRGIFGTTASGQANAEVMLDEHTTVEVSAVGNAAIEQFTGSAWLFATQWSSKRFRLRVGLWYGNYNVPVLNFIIPQPVVIPELDVSYVF